MGQHTTIAIDAMGGDRAPEAIVAGAVRAASELDVRVLLVGLPDAVEPLIPAGITNLEFIATTEFVAMDEAPSSVRTKKDASIVRCAQLVKDGHADGMVSAGNTGATMAAALLRMGRIKGVARPAIAVPIPVPGHRPQIMVDGGAAVDCAPEWLLQFAILGREYARVRFDIDEPRIGLLSNGEEAGKGDDLRKKTSVLLETLPGFIGNVEGRDFMHPGVDVIVTDGFTGNVALKTIEGTIRGTAKLVFDALDDPAIKAAAAAVMPALLAAAATLDPDTEGGAVLLGVDGVCLVGHGSSSEVAIVNAVERAIECVEQRVVARCKEAVEHAR
ncbi:MAG: phosphate acyltransferase PlsX [Acidimicrobiia bacterium]